MYLPSYIHSTNPTFTGVRATIFALAEMYSSLFVTTTPLVKGFLVEFKVVGIKPTFVKSGSGTADESPDSEPDLGSPRKSKDSEKGTAMSDTMTGASGSSRCPRET